MVTIDALPLFASGPHRLIVGGLERRLVESSAPHDIGARLTDHGLLARGLTLIGSLLADNTAALRERVRAVEALVDGQPHTLADGITSWSHVVFIAFEPAEVVRVGPRCRVNYTARFQQVTP